MCGVDPVKMTRQQLEDEVLYLRGELGMRDDQIARLGHAFKLTPQEAYVLSTLYAARGKIIKDGFILDNLPRWRTRDRDENTVKVYIHRIRKRFAPMTVIETAGWHGYRLTSLGIALCDGVAAPKQAA